MKNAWRITIDKTMVGKVIYAIPTGNNETRGVKRQEPEKFLVKGMARKYATLQKIYKDGSFSRQEEKHDPYDGSGFNAGYMFFLTSEDIDYFYNHKELAFKAHSELLYPSWFEELSTETLELIIKELENKED